MNERFLDFLNSYYQKLDQRAAIIQSFRKSRRSRRRNRNRIKMLRSGGFSRVASDVAQAIVDHNWRMN